MARLAPAAMRLATSLQQAVDAIGAPGPGAAPVILLCVKAGATAAAAREIAAVCPAGSTVLSLQNGVDTVQRISECAAGLQVLAGVVPYNLVLRAGNHVHRASSGALQIQRSAISGSMAALLRAAGMPTVLRDDMQSVQWGKLLLNLNNPVNALSGLPLRAQLAQRDYRAVLAALQREALEVLRAAGITPARVSTLPARMLPPVLRLPDWLFARVAARMLRIDASARSSMWDDLQRGRPTEIDELCGAVVRLAARHGRSARYNQSMCELVAAHQSGRQWSASALRAALGV